MEFTFFKDLTSEDQVAEACGDDQEQNDSTLAAESPVHEGKTTNYTLVVFRSWVKMAVTE